MQRLHQHVAAFQKVQYVAAFIQKIQPRRRSILCPLARALRLQAAAGGRGPHRVRGPARRGRAYGFEDSGMLAATRSSTPRALTRTLEP